MSALPRRIECTLETDDWQPWPGTATEVELLLASLPLTAIVGPDAARTQLTQLSARLGPAGAKGRAPTLLELAAAPLLWRLEALDNHFETHLLTGLDVLQDRLGWLTRHPLLAGHRQTDLLDDWLSLVITARGLVTRAEARPDWSRALGPEGETRIRPENALPLRWSRTKLRSVGSPRGSRY